MIDAIQRTSHAAAIARPRLGCGYGAAVGGADNEATASCRTTVENDAGCEGDPFMRDNEIQRNIIKNDQEAAKGQ